MTPLKVRANLTAAKSPYDSTYYDLYVAEETIRRITGEYSITGCLILCLLYPVSLDDCIEILFTQIFPLIILGKGFM